MRTFARTVGAVFAGAGWFNIVSGNVEQMKDFLAACEFAALIEADVLVGARRCLNG